MSFIVKKEEYLFVSYITTIVECFVCILALLIMIYFNAPNAFQKSGGFIVIISLAYFMGNFREILEEKMYSTMRDELTTSFMERVQIRAAAQNGIVGTAIVTFGDIPSEFLHDLKMEGNEWILWVLIGALAGLIARCIYELPSSLKKCRDDMEERLKETIKLKAGRSERL